MNLFSIRKVHHATFNLSISRSLCLFSWRVYKLNGERIQGKIDT